MCRLRTNGKASPSAVAEVDEEALLSQKAGCVIAFSERNALPELWFQLGQIRTLARAGVAQTRLQPLASART
jgi:hypothetical protein